MIIKEYTFEDWLNDRIDYKILDEEIMNISNGLFTLYKGEKLMTKQDYEKIKECQKNAYDLAVKMSTETYINRFQKNYNSSPYQNEYLNSEIQKTEKIINEKPNILNSVLRGNKEYTCIKGSEYQKIVKDKNLLDRGEIKDPAYAYNDNMRITWCYKYLQWLKDFQEQQVKSKKPNAKHKTFPEYLLHDKRKQLAEKIKQNFSTEKGKTMKLVLAVLEEKQLITLGNRQFKAITESLRSYLNRDIGTYSSLNDPKYFDNIDKNPIKTKIDIILNQLSTK